MPVVVTAQLRSVEVGSWSQHTMGTLRLYNIPPAPTTDLQELASLKSLYPYTPQHWYWKNTELMGQNFNTSSYLSVIILSVLVKYICLYKKIILLRQITMFRSEQICLNGTVHIKLKVLKLKKKILRDSQKTVKCFLQGVDI